MENQFNLADLTGELSRKYQTTFPERVWTDKKSRFYEMTEPKNDEDEEDEVYDPEKDAGGPPSRPSKYFVAATKSFEADGHSDSHTLIYGWTWNGTSRYYSDGWSCIGKYYCPSSANPD